MPAVRQAWDLSSALLPLEGRPDGVGSMRDHRTEVVTCVGCGSIRTLWKTESDLFTGCSKKCRRIVVGLLNRLMRTKLHSDEEAKILGRLRMSPPTRIYRRRRVCG